MAECVTSDVDFLLQQWALWSRCNVGISLGWPSVEPYTAMVTSDNRPTPQIQDATARVLDRMMAEFLVHNNLAARVTIAYYVTGLSYARLGEIFSRHRNYVAGLVDLGRHYFLGALNTLGDVA